MKIDIEIFANGDTNLVNIGYIEADTFDPDKCFDLCNWSHWSKEKPDNLHAGILHASHGICFTNPETCEKWLALSIGWKTGNDAEIKEYVAKNINNLFWRSEVE